MFSLYYITIGTRIIKILNTIRKLNVPAINFMSH